MVMDGFYLSRFSFQLRAIDPLRLPRYKGSTFRGGFGHAFKKVVCAIRGKPCSECSLKMKCVYVYIFETMPPEGSEALRNYKSIPHPFIIEPPEDTRCNYEPGEVLSFNLILIGKAVDYLPYFIYTFEELGRIGIGKGRGKYELKEINCDGKQIYNSVDRQLKQTPPCSPSILNAPQPPLKLRGGAEGGEVTSDLLLTRTTGTDTVSLNFLTPARIIVHGDLVVDLEFHQLIRNLLRRISNLSYFHCGLRLEIDFKGLIEKAEKVETVHRELGWYDWERYSARQETRMKLGGFIGTIGFKGGLKPFIPFLSLGEIIHIGKGTSFGLGRYRLEGKGEGGGKKYVNNLS